MRLPPLLPALLLSTVLLPGCARRAGCDAVLTNRSATAVEQLYLAPGATRHWGADLLRDSDLASQASMPLRFPAAGVYALRIVWVDGRAAELAGVAACDIRRVTILGQELRAE
jgi:hypothetical protein